MLLGTFPGTIWKVEKEGKAVLPWYLPENRTSTRSGMAGLAATGDILLANDGLTGQILRFDTTSTYGTPTIVQRNSNKTINADAIYLPPKYSGKVLLAAEDPNGVVVLRSKDGLWKTAEHLGLVPLNKTLVGGGQVPAAVQVGDNVFMVIEYFSDTVVQGTNAGNRTRFPMIDITREVSAMLGE